MSRTDEERKRWRFREDPYLRLRRKLLDVSAGQADDDEFEMSFMEDVLRRDPCHEDALMLLGYAYTRRGDYDKGLAVDRRLVRLRPDDPTVYYNLACSCSLLNRIDESLAALKRSVALGYTDVRHMMTDDDLANLRRDERFKELIERIVRGTGINDS